MTARTVVAAVSTVFTVLIAASVGLAWRLELSGLGRPRDTEPRTSYVALLAIAVVIPLVVTVVAYRWAGLTSWLVPVVLVLGSALLFWIITGLGMG